MSKAVTVLKSKPNSTKPVLDEFFSILENDIIHLLFPIIYDEEEETTQNLILTNEEGTYAEIHVVWASEEVFTNWVNNSELQALRKDFEISFIKKLKEAVEITRYVTWDDSVIDPDVKNYKEFIPADLLYPI